MAIIGLFQCDPWCLPTQKWLKNATNDISIQEFHNIITHYKPHYLYLMHCLDTRPVKLSIWISQNLIRYVIHMCLPTLLGLSQTKSAQLPTTFHDQENQCTLLQHILCMKGMQYTAHYHLQVQANPKKIAPKRDAIFSIYERNGIMP